MKKILGCAALGIPLLAILARSSARPFQLTMNYLPHRYCSLAPPLLIWANVTLDGLIALSYFVIFTCLLWIVGQLRRLPQIRSSLWIFISFGSFILACAATHVMAVVSIWWPVYRLSILFKLGCAAAAVTTALLCAQAVHPIIAGIRRFLDKLASSQREHASEIAENTRIEAHVRDTEARLQKIVDSVLDSIISTHATGIIVSINPAVVKMFGYETGDIVGHDIRMLIPESSRVSLDAFLARGPSMDSTTAMSVGRKLKGLTKTGRIFPIELTTTEVSLDGQRLFVIVIRDIAYAEQELKRQAALLDLAHDAILVRDLRGQVVFWNPGARRLYGWTAEEAYGRVSHELLQTKFPRPLAAIAEELASKGMWEGELRHRVRNDSEIVVSSRWSMQHDELGLPNAILEINRDITARKQAEERLEGQAKELAQQSEDLLRSQAVLEGQKQMIIRRTTQVEDANHELEAFSYSISHDLRAPLRHIGGFSRILITDFGAEMAPEARGHLQRIEDAVIRMGLLVDGLLGLAKLGRQALHIRQNELNPIVDEVILVLQPECEGRKVEWRIGRLPALECDQILIGQVFQNLLHNALKYSRGRAPAVIEVGSIQRPGEPAIIFVHDNGAGFHMEYAQKLFGAFQRMHTDSEFEGSGIGLATVHRIIQKHGGSIWAEAEPDHGANFYFTLGNLGEDGKSNAALLPQ